MVLFVIAVCYDLCTTFRTIFEIMAFIDEQPVDAQLLKGHGVVLGALIVELLQPRLQ